MLIPRIGIGDVVALIGYSPIGRVRFVTDDEYAYVYWEDYGYSSWHYCGDLMILN